MKPNCLMHRLVIAGRWIATTLFCLTAIAFIWQGAVFSNTAAMAAPVANLIASANVGDRVQGKAREDAGRTKSFIQDTADRVEQTAKRNANQVDRATDNGSPIGRKAQRDAARIEQRAEQDAARTQKAVDNTKNAIERTADSIKNVFSN
ncbi:MAG: hypothetical protein HC866_01745 [Leptolyngbyaceae cyanobacterium RU_5_1]|nr:hypothetical protein [Leptolyngbyaceae cyanobacterium RU_5_1]